MNRFRPTRPLYLALAALVALGSTLGAAAHAAELVIVPGPLQLVEFESEAPVENIRGLTTEASGAIAIDLAKPSTATATVRVPVASLRTGNTTRDADLREPGWLDAAHHPDLVFTLRETRLDLAGPLAPGVVATGRVRGTLEIRGQVRPVDVPVKLAYLAASEKLEKAYIHGNALRVKGELTVALADFGVVVPEHIAGVKVADVVTLRFALTAQEK